VAPRVVVTARLPAAVLEALARDGFELVDSDAELAVVELDELPRRAGVRTVVVAARDEFVGAFAAGADDVVPPSVAPAELAARLHALLRRPLLQTGVLRFADVVLDLARHEVRRGELELELTATEFRLLRYLLEHPRRVVSKAELLAGVWLTEEPRRSNVVETYIRYLRRKLDAAGPPLIHTVRQAGYMLDDAA
jgi:two-component system OmpR family response regulator